MIIQMLVVLCMFLFALLLRALYLILIENGRIPKSNSRHSPVRTLIILGSGGHTTEMLRIVADMKRDRYSPRIYVRASTDLISEAKVKALEGEAADYQLIQIRRSREVHQPYLASVWTTLAAILDSLPIVFTSKPDLVLCNGPGTCIPLCLVTFLYKILFLTNARIVFIESFCRVKTLSLSGKISLYLADFVVVRWKTLRRKIAMDKISQLARNLLPSESLLNDIQTNSPPEIRIHLTSIFQKLWNHIHLNEEKVLTDKWIQTAAVRLEACLDRTWESLNSGYWKDVPISYRYCYSFCAILKSTLLLTRLKHEETRNSKEGTVSSKLKEIILQIDKGILLGAPPLSMPELLPTIARQLNSTIVGMRVFTYKKIPFANNHEINEKKCSTCNNLVQLSDNVAAGELLPGFTPVTRCYRPSMEAFHRDIFGPKTPAVLEGCIDHWKALDLWRNPEYLLRTAGVRTVPIEIGSRYTEEDWTQRLVTFAEFLEAYVTSDGSSKPGYLAQHELFNQIPELMDDISIPDYCSFSDTEEEATVPDINAWLGPRGTISPLHFDPKNNLLCQVFGTKQVVLFSPEETPHLYPYETRLLSNTARVDPVNPDYQAWPKFKNATGTTCTLRPGEMLFIPPGWWHHVIALAPSFSVSFWWK